MQFKTDENLPIEVTELLRFAGYVVLRLKQQDKYSVLEIMEHLIPMFNQEHLENRLWIVDEQKVRIRQ